MELSKVILIAVIGFMAWQSPEIRTTTADVLESAAETVRPESERGILGPLQRAARENGFTR
jgi:hypothetical protein